MILFENMEGWGKMLDTFNQSNVCRTLEEDGGKNALEIFENWLIANYDIPKELIIPKEEEYKHLVGGQKNEKK